MKNTFTDQEIQVAVDGAFVKSNKLELTTLTSLTENHSERWKGESEYRLEILKSALDKLPEPQPPTADGKTPGQVCHESMYNTPEWKWLLAGDKAACEAAASAVLAAFGVAGLEQAIARMEAVPLKELEKAWDSASCDEGSDSLANAFNEVRARLIAAAREGHDPAAVDWKARHDELQKAYAGHADVTAALHDKVQKAEAELALMTLDYDKCRKERGELLNQRDQLLARPQLSTLRPIAEAGEVPAGAVRYYFYFSQGEWLTDYCESCDVTHFADILIPEAKAPAVEVARIKPAATFTAHGKTWNVHVPGDERPCEGGVNIDILDRSGVVYCNQPTHHHDSDFWTAEYWNPIIGWRYADEPTQEADKNIISTDNNSEKVSNVTIIEKPWIPEVGDVVILKSSGPKMTIKKIEDNTITCLWFDNLNKRVIADFPAATLRLA